MFYFFLRFFRLKTTCSAAFLPTFQGVWAISVCGEFEFTMEAFKRLANSLGREALMSLRMISCSCISVAIFFNFLEDGGKVGSLISSKVSLISLKSSRKESFLVSLGRVIAVLITMEIVKGVCWIKFSKGVPSSPLKTERNKEIVSEYAQWMEGYKARVQELLESFCKEFWYSFEAKRLLREVLPSFKDYPEKDLPREGDESLWNGGIHTPQDILLVFGKERVRVIPSVGDFILKIHFIINAGIFLAKQIDQSLKEDPKIHSLDEWDTWVEEILIPKATPIIESAKAIFSEVENLLPE